VSRLVFGIAGVVEVPERDVVGRQTVEPPVGDAHRDVAEFGLAGIQRLRQRNHGPGLRAAPSAVLVDALVRVAAHESAVGRIETRRLTHRAVLAHAQRDVLAQVVARDLVRVELEAVCEQQRDGAGQRVDVRLVRADVGRLLGLGAERDQPRSRVVHLHQPLRSGTRQAARDLITEELAAQLGARTRTGSP
jgi:hypothetical protein